MSTIDISVIIPVYNASALLDRCLDSVFNQVGNYNIEVILVDDGSTDNSVTLIKQRKEQERIRLFCQANSGPAKARNKGITAACGKYLTFLDADDYWLPGFLEATYQFLETHPECVAVSVAQRHITFSGTHESPHNWDKLSNPEGSVIDDFFSFWGRYNHICTGSILIRTKVVKSLGGMREDLRSCEDIEFWNCVASKGKMGYIPIILFVSDGNKVTTVQGWSKYTFRFRDTVDFGVWNLRLAKLLSPEQISSASKQYDKIVLGITRSYICGKKFKKAKDNLKYYSKGGQPHYILRYASYGHLVWYSFATAYLFYRYLKISIPFFKHKLGL